MSEEAKAVQEVAKATGKVVDASLHLGAFAKEVFGDLLVDGFGLLRDKLKFYRLENAILVEQEFRQRLADKGIYITQPVLPKVGVPLIEHATIEDNKDLRTKWANMLTNAADPNYKGVIKRSYVSILADMEPLDVLILDTLAKEYLKLPTEQKEQSLFDRAKIVEVLKISMQDAEISLRNLLRLGCLKPGVVTGGVAIGEHRLSAYKDTELVGITELGLDFFKAVN